MNSLLLFAIMVALIWSLWRTQFMLSIEECRQLIASDESYSDDQIKQIREYVYTMAQLAVKNMNKQEQLLPNMTDSRHMSESK